MHGQCYARPTIKGKEKGKEEYLFSAIFADTPLTKRSHMDHTVLPANYTMSAFCEANYLPSRRM